ncbi:metallophosphoesterase [Nocardioides sp.]|uniref:metallophosphoesterase n=1 Tax=Nocardioides sp. TaxID=35761 RepID=UPI0039E53684
MTLRRVLVVAAYVATWLVLAVLAFLLVFLGSSRQTTFLSHDAVLRPDFSGTVEVHTGPVLPDVRLPSHALFGVSVTLGKTDVGSLEELVERYAYLASAADGERAKVRATVASMVVDAALRGAVLGSLPLLVWRLVGRQRRREIYARLPSRRGLALIGLVLTLVVAAWQPWVADDEEDRVSDDQPWLSLGEFLGGSVPLPAGVEEVQVRGDVTTLETRRLVESALSTYDTSKQFYADAAERAAGLSLRRPEADETVVVVVSDRHDNVGMDQVARAVGDAAGATSVYDLGDDTSTGSRWEAFSLDSVTAAFDGYDKWAISGNHDNGTFVSDYLAEDGWTELTGETLDGPGGSVLLGVPDPRASGLGNWRDEKGLSFAEVADRLADAACDSDRRITTLLVHDANLGRPALDRGCVDLVLGGHLHLFLGPTAVTAPDGSVGWTFTTGTTGGAAYAFALGSKPRRQAGISLVTYDADGVPAGIQAVRLETNGEFSVDDYVPLTSG